MIRKTVQLHDQDNVVTCLAAMEAGAVVATGAGDVTLRGPVPFAHKIAIREIRAGDDVIKYGEVIGRASTPIGPGDWVHTHNVDSARARGDLA